MMAAIRREIAWFERATARSLPTMAVGGLEVPAAVPMSVFPCPEPTCDFRDGSPETTLQHAWSEHGRDRRRTERRAA